jgi:hypothetical protein
MNHKVEEDTDMKAIVALGSPHSIAVQDALEAHGVEVLFARSTKDAIEHLRANHDQVGLVVVGGCVERAQREDGQAIVEAIRNNGFNRLIAGVACCLYQWKMLSKAGCNNLLADDLSLYENLAGIVRQAKIRMGVPC